MFIDSCPHPISVHCLTAVLRWQYHTWVAAMEDVCAICPEPEVHQPSFLPVTHRELGNHHQSDFYFLQWTKNWKSETFMGPPEVNILLKSGGADRYREL